MNMLAQANYMPMPWWFLPAMFAPLWVPVVVLAALSLRRNR